MSAAQKALKGGSGFNDMLAKSYYDYASQRLANKEYTDADFFGRKSLAASSGETVSPEDNKRWAIAGQGDMQTRTQMDQQRNRLLAALDGGGRTKFPVLAAHAQVHYDCWVERTEQNFQAGWHGDCYNMYLSDIADLEVAMRPQYQVYFAYNSSKLDANAMKTISDAAAGLPKEGTWRYQVVGKADRSGSDAYNQKISQARAEAVRAGLVNAGVPANRIDVSATGEKQLPVPTAEHAKEPRNRVVFINPSVPGAQQTSMR